MSKYYNGVRIVNNNYPFNFSIGNRSAGKSFYWKRYVIKRFLKTGEQFIYLRRYWNDIELSIDTWFDDIGQTEELKQYQFEARSGCFYLIDGEEKNLCGFYYALTTASKIKSIPLEKVNTIFFDEFIPEDLKYLKPTEPAYEPGLLLSIYLTVARGYKRVIRDEVKVICVANMVSLYNPYFSFFGVDLTKSDVCVYKNVYAEKITQTDISDEIKKSRIGVILENTNYGNYALNNKSKTDIDRHIQRKPNLVYAWFELYFDKWYIFYLGDDGNLYIQPGYDKTLKRKYKIREIDIKEDVKYFCGDVVKSVRSLAEYDMIYYSDAKTKAALAGFLESKIRR